MTKAVTARVLDWPPHTDDAALWERFVAAALARCPANDAVIEADKAVAHYRERFPRTPDGPYR